jgi:hypothetical protein
VTGARAGWEKRVGFKIEPNLPAILDVRSPNGRGVLYLAKKINETYVYEFYCFLEPNLKLGR